MTNETIREEEEMTHERLLEPKKIIDEIEKLKMHSDYLGHVEMKTLYAQMKKKGSFSKNENKTAEDTTSKGNKYILQWKLLNVITLGQRQIDNINRMKTIKKDEIVNILFPLFELKQITVK
jgi:hypothetical protein